ncbi:hypothetical protein [Tateyamaria pelophila]|nr:hypothetical protein [Tateyamaria pelophila]
MNDHPTDIPARAQECGLNDQQPDTGFAVISARACDDVMATT